MDLIGTLVEVAAKYWMQEQCGLVLIGFGIIWRRLKNYSVEQKAIKDAILALLRDSILQSCRYYKNIGEVPLAEREVLDGMFTEYFALGGNGVIKHLKKEMDELQTEIHEIH